jgi:PleD family two-component response regulator
MSNLFTKQEVIIKWENIEEIMKRKVLNSFQGIDVITMDKKCYTFNLTQIQNCDDFFKNMKTLVKEKADKGEELPLRLIDNPVNYFKNVEQYQNEWKNG